MDPYRSLLYCSHDRDKVSVWKWPSDFSSKQARLNTFSSASSLSSSPFYYETLDLSNHIETERASFTFENETNLSEGEENISATSTTTATTGLSGGVNETVTSMEVVNPSLHTLLLVGTDAGVVRVWKGVEERGNTEMVGCFRAVESEGKKSVKMVSDWNQFSGTLMVGGDTGQVRLWDLEEEKLVQEFLTPSSVTNICSGLNSTGKLRLLTLSDGSVRVIDWREAQRSFSSKRGHLWSEHKKCIRSAHLSMDQKTIVAADIDGLIKIFDVRSSVSVKTLKPKLKEFSCMTVHDFAPVIACGSRNQKIVVIDTEGNELSVIRQHIGFLGQRISSVTSLAFHPYKLFLAAGFSDSLASVYSPLHTY